MQRKITIIMDGGLIHDIQGIPPDIAIIVRDYDVEDWHPDDRQHLLTDDNGDKYSENSWGEFSDDDSPTRPALPPEFVGFGRLVPPEEGGVPLSGRPNSITPEFLDSLLLDKPIDKPKT